MKVAAALKQQDWDDTRLKIYAKSTQDVERALNAAMPSIEDFLALISPAAEAYLEPMAQRAKQLTRKRFGNTVGLFIPLYLSNLCANECTYCGFTMSNRIKRKTLGLEEIHREIVAIKAMGFDTILLVTGEHETKVGMKYFREVIPVIKKFFSYVMLEVQPLSEQDYVELRQLGVDAVLVYQETYHPPTYRRYHLRGNKADYDWRLNTSDRLALSGMDKIGIGALLGLADWRTDSAMTAVHAMLLYKHYWRCRVSIAFPRLRPCSGVATPGQSFSGPTDKQLVQLICAHRILHPQAELTLSTREPAQFRDNLVPLAVTHISAASQTAPGGYSEKTSALTQFDTDDTRPVPEVIQSLCARGLDAVFTDWLPGYSG